MSIRRVATAEIMRLTEDNVYVTPEMVVQEARPEGSPLHDLFEWDNEICGEKYRLIQARMLIRIVREIDGEDEDGMPVYVRALTSAKRAGREEPGYLTTREVLKSEVSEAILLRALKREVASLNKRFRHLKQFGQIVREELGELNAG
jgi:hypothetical protein